MKPEPDPKNERQQWNSENLGAGGNDTRRKVPPFYGAQSKEFLATGKSLESISSRMIWRMRHFIARESIGHSRPCRSQDFCSG